MATGSDASRMCEYRGMYAEKPNQPSPAPRMGRLFMAMTLVAAALGLWLMPVDGGEAGMRLLKLLVSLMLLGAGGVIATARR